MVCDTSDPEGRAFECLGNAAQISVEGITGGFVAKPWPALLRGESQVNINSGKRLWHRSPPRAVSRITASRQPSRDGAVDVGATPTRIREDKIPL